ncbi:adhesin [Vibrio algarum]|uniref:Adhesin n=1 Tax=Vibrio algarum TaxID=3020714 RepID=A0ABT4YXB3_9VIBR|nr:adhesin [Vibrio sp. KJ40-1]MDB1126230.1 adhesin [Vibrio sp. KJ40-1]
MKTSFLALTLASILIGCGGSDSSGDSSDNNDSESSATLTGVFVDSPVGGISYRTETKEGTTNELGEYDYVDGETVTFFINGLAFPPVLASGIVTPMDMSDESTTQTNILQILQTLDSDGNPENGITIDAETTAAFANVSGLDLTSDSFDTDVAGTLSNLGLTIISEADAQAHFQSTLLGSWILSEGENKRNILTFIDESHYIIIHEHSDDGDQESGSVEYGTYTWDLNDGSFLVNIIGQSDSTGGLSDLSADANISVNQDNLTFTVPQEGEFTFTRVTNDDNSLIGGWSMYEQGDDNWNILSFISGTEYVIAHTNNQEYYSDESPQAYSGEFGTYNLDDTGQFAVLSASVDSDGQGGLYNDDESSDQDGETITVHPWGDLNFFDQDEGSFSFARIGRFSTTTEVNVLDGSDSTLLLGDLANISVTRSDDFYNFRDDYDSCAFVVTTTNDGENIPYNNFSLQLASNGAGTVVYTNPESTSSVTWNIDSSGTLIWQVSESVKESHFVRIKGQDNAILASMVTDADGNTEDTLVEATFTCIE